MRIETIERKIYLFDELSEAAKNEAREWYRRGLYDFSDSFNFTIEDSKTVGLLMGIDIKEVFYSLSYSQGAGACFEGSYSYKKGSVKALKEFAPTDTVLHKIVEGLQAVQKKNFYGLSSKVTAGRAPNSYSASIYTVKDTLSGEDFPTENDERELIDLLRDFMNWIYSQLLKEDEYINSSESIDENILCNDYEFLENGKKA